MTVTPFQEMARDEEQHADGFEAQLDAIARISVEDYVAQQVNADQSPA